MANLHDFIERAGITQRQMAERIGCSTSFLSEVLSGRKAPGVGLALRIERETGGAVPVAAWPKFRSIADAVSGKGQ